MADQPPTAVVELVVDEEEPEPLVPEDPGCAADELELETVMDRFSDSDTGEQVEPEAPLLALVG